MPTAREYRHNAEICLKLARETNEIYARTALLELATESRAMAEYLERGVYRRRQRRALPAPRERRTAAFSVQGGQTVQQQQQIRRGHETKDE